MSTTVPRARRALSAAPVWLVRAGREGQDEATALEQGLAIIGFNDVPDLSSASSAEEIAAPVRQPNPPAREKNVQNRSSQLAAFVLQLREGDIVALPLKTRPGRVALGRVKGCYAYREIGGAMRHTRPVEWVRPDVPRSDFHQDLLYSLGAFMTVCRIQRNDAEARIAAMLAGERDPGGDALESGGGEPEREGAVSDAAATVNIAQVAHDQILAHIQTRFAGHDLARLVDAVLQAEGYSTCLSPAGPDGGVDILAGRGSLGFDGPRLCVQVKSSPTPADVNVLRSLQGSMQTFRAD